MARPRRARPRRIKSVKLPAAAAAVGAPAPRRVPELIARVLIGNALTAWLTTMRGADNGKAKRELGWTPRYPSWREGFRAL